VPAKSRFVIIEESSWVRMVRAFGSTTCKAPSNTAGAIARRTMVCAAGKGDCREPVANVLRAGNIVGLANHTLLVRRDGMEVPIDDSGAPIRGKNNEIVGVVLVFRDITERRQSEEALRQSDASRLRLAAIIDSADDAIVSKNLNGIVSSWNEGACRMFGYSATEMVGQSILRLIPEDLHYEEDEILRKMRAGERIDHYETRRTKKNGDSIEVSVTISPIRDESGRIIGASKIARDISNRKRVERQLVQSEKLAATGRMAATIAHEINNPLESLVNLIFLARQDSGPDGRVYTATSLPQKVNCSVFLILLGRHWVFTETRVRRQKSISIN
jgi:PAS domain S-box-containing protein